MGYMVWRHLGRLGVMRRDRVIGLELGRGGTTKHGPFLLGTRFAARVLSGDASDAKHENSRKQADSSVVSPIGRPTELGPG